MKQSARESLARTRGVIDVTKKYFVQTVDLARTIRQPLARIPAGIKFSGTQNGFRPVRHRQLRVENRPADFQMRVERLACDEETHDFTRTFEDCVDSTIAQKSFHSDWWLPASGQRCRSLISAPAAHLH